MPKKIHRKLQHQAEKKGFTGERKVRYIYGTLHKIEQAQRRKKK